MKDLLFSGKDVEEAVALASQTLGMARTGLRYVVLAEGTPGRFGGTATPAQIAVLLDQAGRPRTLEATPLPAPERRTPAALVGLLKDVAGLNLEISLREREEGPQITIAGPDTGFLLEGDAALLQGLEHLLQRVAQQQGLGRLSFICEGYREWRDEALRKSALALAQEVLQDGGSRSTGPLNSYERRIIHLAIEAVEGVTTRSVGEGGERRVTVAPASAAGGTESPHPAEQ